MLYLLLQPRQLDYRLAIFHNAVDPINLVEGIRHAIYAPRPLCPSTCPIAIGTADPLHGLELFFEGLQAKGLMQHRRCIEITRRRRTRQRQIRHGGRPRDQSMVAANLYVRPDGNLYAEQLRRGSVPYRYSINQRRDVVATLDRIHEEFVRQLRRIYNNYFERRLVVPIPIE
eukprot:6198938-Pyramimonas_sp.AAC.1